MKPLVMAGVAKVTLIHADEYGFHARKQGYERNGVCHAETATTPATVFTRSTSARSRGSGRCRALGYGPHRGISREKLPLYLAFCQFVHDARALVETLIAPVIRSV